MDAASIIMCAQKCALRRFEHADPERLRKYIDSEFECPLDDDVKDLHDLLGRSEDVREWCLFQDAYLMTVVRLLHNPGSPPWEFVTDRPDRFNKRESVQGSLAVSKPVERFNVSNCWLSSLVSINYWPLNAVLNLFDSLSRAYLYRRMGRRKGS